MLVGFCEVSSGLRFIRSIDLRAPTSRADSEIRKRNRQMKCVFSIVPPAHVATDRSFPEYAARHDQLSKSAGKSGFKMRHGSGRTARVCGALIGNFIDTRSRLKAVDRSHSSRSSVHRSDTCRPFYGESGTGRKPKNRVVIGPEFVNNFLPVFLDSALAVLRWSRSFAGPLLPRATRTCTSSVEAHKGNERIFVRTPNSKQRAIVLA